MFLASAHTHPHIVEWLLDSGVSVDTECGHHQKAIDVIGQSNAEASKIKQIKALLRLPLKVLQPPPKPTCRAKLGYEEVVKTIFVDGKTFLWAFGGRI